MDEICTTHIVHPHMRCADGKIRRFDVTNQENNK